MTLRTKRIISLVINLAIIIMEIVGIALSAYYYNYLLLEFYTQDSNVLLFITCVIYTVYLIICLKRNDAKPPKYALVLKYIATCTVTLTFLVVLFVLIPMGGPGAFVGMLFKGTMLFMHFLCPVLAIIVLLTFDREEKLEFKHTLYALIPTIIYALIAMLLNIFKVIEGPYPFLLVYKQPVYMSILWAVIIIGAAYLINFVLYKAYNALYKKDLSKN